MVCPPDGECYWEVGFNCDFGPPYPRPTPTPIPPFERSTAPTGSVAEIAAQYGEDDTNGDGILSCNGVYYLASGTWVGSCD